MTQRFTSIEQVKNKLQVEDFKNLTDDKVEELASLVPYMDKDVAISIIEQFPAYAQSTENIVDQVRKMCETALEHNERSQKEVFDAYGKVLDALVETRKTKWDDMSSEERQQNTRDMFTAAEAIYDKDTEGKKFIEAIVKHGSIVALAALVMGASVLGVRTRKGHINNAPVIKSDNKSQWWEYLVGGPQHILVETIKRSMKGR